MKIYEQTFDQPQDLPGGLEAEVYELCYFASQNLSGQDLSNIKFIECTFRDCDLSNAIIGGTALQEVKFINCKLLGLDFTHASSFLLQLHFEHCQLDFCNFVDLPLKNTDFGQSRLLEADFTNADLSRSDLSGCDLNRTIFQQTKLVEADLRAALNFDIDPEYNQLRKAQFSADGLMGLLRKHRIVMG